jgi:uncharacterized protein
MSKFVPHPPLVSIQRTRKMATASACAMAVMGKASAPGRTKTRLIPLLSAEDAAHLNTAFLKDIVGNLLRARQLTEIAPYVAFGPADSAPFFREYLPATLPLIECWLPDFGDCLELAITTLLRRGHAAACVLNADSPSLPTRLLVQAAGALAQPSVEIVIGPSTDGGYYLLGMKRVHRRLFEDIDWSTPRVFEQTRERASELGLRVTVLDPWYDVDDAEGLHRLRGDLALEASAVTSGMYAAPFTRAALAWVGRHLESTAKSQIPKQGEA